MPAIHRRFSLISRCALCVSAAPLFTAVFFLPTPDASIPFDGGLDGGRETRWRPLSLSLFGQTNQPTPTNHNLQAARFADPGGHCLSPSSGADQPSAEGLGVFTCVADTPFFLRALAESLHFPFVVVVDVGSVPLRHHLPASPPVLGAAFTELESEMFPEAPQLQARHRLGII